MLKDKIEREHRLIYKVFIYHLFYYNDNEAFIILKDIYTDILTWINAIIMIHMMVSLQILSFTQ